MVTAAADAAATISVPVHAAALRCIRDQMRNTLLYYYTIVLYVIIIIIIILLYRCAGHRVNVFCRQNKKTNRWYVKYNMLCARARLVLM